MRQSYGSGVLYGFGGDANGGLSEDEDWCYDMGICGGGLISESECLEEGGKCIEVNGGVCYMSWSVVQPNSAEQRYLPPTENRADTCGRELNKKIRKK